MPMFMYLYGCVRVSRGGGEGRKKSKKAKKKSNGGDGISRDVDEDVVCVVVNKASPLDSPQRSGFMSNVISHDIPKLRPPRLSIASAMPPS